MNKNNEKVIHVEFAHNSYLWCSVFGVYSSELPECVLACAGKNNT